MNIIIADYMWRKKIWTDRGIHCRKIRYRQQNAKRKSTARQVQESKIQTDKIKKEKSQRMIVTDETSVYGIDMACFHEKQEE